MKTINENEEFVMGDAIFRWHYNYPNSKTGMIIKRVRSLAVPASPVETSEPDEIIEASLKEVEKTKRKRNGAKQVNPD